jgi:dsRNA-specific ribonuclease
MELYHRYPSATPGDLMLLQSCVVCDDALAYIMTKNGLCDPFFDSLLFEFNELVERADAHGSRLWHERGGWIVPGGGHDEFRKRCGRDNSDENLKTCRPRYPGLHGGRLYGHTKKLPKNVTGDLAFSLQSLVGALIMLHGLDETWQSFLCPLVLETLLLSADEIRTYCDGSTMAQNYMSGKPTIKQTTARSPIIDAIPHDFRSATT